MGRMQSPSTTRTSFSLPEHLLDDLDAIADAEDKSRSEKLREMVEREVGAGDQERDEWVPQTDVHADVYLAAVEHSRKPDHVLRLDVFREQVAQEAGVSTSTVEKVLFILQGAGYVRRMVGSPSVDRSLDSWRVKPKCADPKKWKHRKTA